MVCSAYGGLAYSIYRGQGFKFSLWSAVLLFSCQENKIVRLFVQSQARMNARGSAGQYKQFRRKAKLVREDAEVVHAQYMSALKASWQNTCRLQLRPVVVKALVASHEPWMQK